MYVENAVFAIAGTFALTGALLAWLVSPWWLLLPAFIGANMLQAAFTQFCLAEVIFRKLGMKSRCTKTA